ncbi:MAG TPA: hypothetical protein VHM28_09125 [Anaerolineales bacterium]|jgi:hypothetical protein|nr:hypothetical protein [Anaerolineales bacterium]
MKSKYLFANDFLLIIPASLILSAGLAALQGGTYWIGWLGFSALWSLGLIALFAAWRWAGSGKTLAWMIALAVLLRVAAGVVVYIALPLNGYDVPDDKAGYVFTDAHRRDDQAWELASSGKPLWSAFDKTYYTDQYGGLLAFSALAYKIFSLDVHRPLLILLLAALTAAIGVPSFYRATRLLWDEKLAAVSTWLFVAYPESVLTGGAQMREPFLLTFIAMSYWGFAIWLKEGNRNGWTWIGIGLAGMLLVSPAMALVLIIFFGVWLWLRGEKARLPLPVLAALVGVFFIGLLLLAWSLSRQNDFGGGSPFSVILNWSRDSVRYVIYQLERGSGQIQGVFSKMNPLTQFLFVIGYGIAQPVLPPAFFEPTTLTWRIIAILRALGWYTILPFLLYSLVAAWKSEPGPERRLWLWLPAFSWIWILICAIRAGGDQWDNPRYRLIFFGWQALVAGRAWIWWRQHRDAWLLRILTLEIICVLLYGEWYLARYNLVGIHLPVTVVISLSLIVLIIVFVGGWLWDRWKAKKVDA